jgi:hypothetical protein
MKAFGWTVVAIIGFFVLWGLGIAFGLISTPFHAASNVVQTKQDVIDKVVNANNALYNYDWFKQQAQDIIAIKAQIADAAIADNKFENDAGPRKDWDYTTETEDARLSSVYQGLIQQEEQLIADYNAHASEADKNIFMNGIVPNFFDVNQMVGGISLGGQNEK